MGSGLVVLKTGPADVDRVILVGIAEVVGGAHGEVEVAGGGGRAGEPAVGGEVQTAGQCAAKYQEERIANGFDLL